MAIEAPFPELDELLLVIGEAGRRLSEIEAIEGAAGNISVYLGWSVEPRRKFPISETIELPEAVPELAGKSFMVSGSGRRLREIIQDPAANLGFVTVNEGGQAGTLYTSPRRLVNGSCPCATCRRASPLAAFHGERMRLARSRTGRRAVYAGDERTGTGYRLCVVKEGGRYAT